MNYNKQNGFGMVEIMVVTVTVLLVFFGIWRVYEANQSQNKIPNNQNQTQTDPNQGYVVIKEWQVRFKPVEGLVGVQYRLGSYPNTEGAVAFTTTAIAKYGGRCDFSDGSAPLGRLVRTKAPIEKAPPFGDPFKHIEGQYYYYIPPQSSCAEGSNPEAEALQLKTLNPLFKPSIATLEIAK